MRGADAEEPAALPPPVGLRLARTLGPLLPFVLVMMGVSLAVGAQPIAFGDIAHSLRKVGWGLFGAPGAGWTSDDIILWTLRGPRVVAAALVGFILGSTGASLQGLFRNPLADPYLIGVSAGAAVGWAAGLLLGFDQWAGGLGMAGIGFLTGLLSLALVYRLSMVGGRVAMESLILAGVVVGSLMWSGLVLTMTLLRPMDLREVFFFLLGNFTAARWDMVAMLAGVTMPGFLALWALAQPLNLLALGDEAAASLGLDPARAQRRVLVVAAVLTAAAVAVSGVIGFIGLVMPHLARRIVGADHRVLLPVAGCVGAVFLVWADALARSQSDVFPVGVLTAVLGAPFFLYVLRRTHR